MISVTIPPHILGRTDLTSTCKLIYSVFKYYDADKEPLQMKHKELMEILGLGYRTMTRSIRKLSEANLITYQTMKGCQDGNIYEINGELNK